MLTSDQHSSFLVQLSYNDLQLGLDPDGLRESLAILDIFQDLVVRQTLEREGAEGNYLVEKNPVAPDIRHRAEYSVRQTLRGHPSHRQHPPSAEPIIIRVKHLTSHPEVGQLDGPAGVDKAVPAGHVSVHISAIEQHQ